MLYKLSAVVICARTTPGRFSFAGVIPKRIRIGIRHLYPRKIITFAVYRDPRVPARRHSGVHYTMRVHRMRSSAELTVHLHINVTPCIIGPCLHTRTHAHSDDR